MGDIVNEILQVEKKVAQTIQEAREKAAALRQQSDREIAAMIAEVREKARERVQRAVDEALRGAERVRGDRLREAEEQSEALAQKNSVAIDELVREAVKLIVGTAYDEECE